MNGTLAVILAVILGAYMTSRWFRHREIMAMVERGIAPARYYRERRSNSLRSGLILTAVGLALTLAMWPIGFRAGSDFPLGCGPWMLAGLVPLFVGLAMIIAYFLTGEYRRRQDEEEEWEEGEE